MLVISTLSQYLQAIELVVNVYIILFFSFFLRCTSMCATYLQENENWTKLKRLTSAQHLSDLSTQTRPLSKSWLFLNYWIGVNKWRSRCCGAHPCVLKYLHENENWTEFFKKRPPNSPRPDKASMAPLNQRHFRATCPQASSLVRACSMPH